MRVRFLLFAIVRKPCAVFRKPCVNEIKKRNVPVLNNTCLLTILLSFVIIIKVRLSPAFAGGVVFVRRKDGVLGGVGEYPASCKNIYALSVRDHPDIKQNYGEKNNEKKCRKNS